MSKIKAHFHTNIDIGRCVDWPKYLCCRPQIGDYVRSFNNIDLKIVRITHCAKRDAEDLYGEYLSIELH